MLIAQITDCHIVEPGDVLADRVDTAPLLEATIAQINSLSTPPDVVVATGDLVNDGSPPQYARLVELLSPLTIPVIPIPGNHDDRTQLRRLFADVVPAGPPDQPLDHTVDLGDVLMVMLDTTIPGEIGGAVSSDQLEWLDTVLSTAPRRPTIIFQHHPPFPTGIGFMDQYPFQGCAEYESLISRHQQVELVSCGHLHRSITRRFAATVACTWPSTCAQLDLVLDGAPPRYVNEPPAFALHHWEPTSGVRSHLVTVGDFTAWTPSWANNQS